ncbi:porin [Vibrio sp. SCSIO 43137]|uniref:porin n=1 Tax=Vibrio sp. SCSIO 43137 TaxID=3021011 RepID=UPI0023079F40|nr:porin [Vibrio sp. SCSIO 43137]WCE31429.1 porin [Vibrio sp. SCSIO 43137]
MDKKIIALAVAAVFATPLTFAQETGNTVYSDSGTSLKVGGRAEARLSVQDGKTEDKTRIRLNMLGKVDIQDGLYGIGFYELEYQANDESATKEDDEFDTRKAYAGIGGAFGEITYGKNDAALGVVTDFTDIMAYHGAKASYKSDIADRTDNIVSYKGAFNDLSLKASYRFADRTETGGEYDDNDKSGYSVSAIYNFSDLGLSIGAGAAKQDADTSAAEEDQYMIAISYTIGGLYLGAFYEDGEVADDDKTAYEVAAKYTMDKFVFSTSYGKQELEDDTSAEATAIDMTYFFKDNFRTYISYEFNMMDEGDKYGTTTVTKAKAEDELALGLRYDF